MGKLTMKSSTHKQTEPSLLSQMTIHFEYNKTIPEARAEVRSKQVGA